MYYSSTSATGDTSDISATSAIVIPVLLYQ